MAHFQNNPNAEVVLIGTNRSGAGVLKHADSFGIPTYVFTKSMLQSGEVLAYLQSLNLDLIALAGFLLHVPAEMVAAFPQRIVNIHPSLLPKYGGAGMYGMHVHEAVKAAGETLSGPTIHFVNEHYDEGAIVFQAIVELSDSDSADDIAHKVLVLEHAYYPIVLENLCKAFD